MTRLVNKTAFTLIEVVLALTLSAVIMGSVAMILDFSFMGWQKGNANDELAQHARIALDQITRELRYANKILQVQQPILEFETTTLLDQDPTTVERIRYELVISGSRRYIRRSINAGPSHVIAGSEFMNGTIRVDPFSLIGYRKVAGSLVPLSIPPDNPSMAEAVYIGITVFDSASNNSISVGSMAMLRN